MNKIEPTFMILATYDCTLESRIESTQTITSLTLVVLNVYKSLNTWDLT